MDRMRFSAAQVFRVFVRGTEPSANDEIERPSQPAGPSSWVGNKYGPLGFLLSVIHLAVSYASLRLALFAICAAVEGADPSVLGQVFVAIWMVTAFPLGYLAWAFIDSFFFVFFWLFLLANSFLWGLGLVSAFRYLFRKSSC